MVTAITLSFVLYIVYRVLRDLSEISLKLAASIFVYVLCVQPALGCRNTTLNSAAPIVAQQTRVWKYTTLTIYRSLDRPSLAIRIK